MWFVSSVTGLQYSVSPLSLVRTEIYKQWTKQFRFTHFTWQSMQKLQKCLYRSQISTIFFLIFWHMIFMFVCSCASTRLVIARLTTSRTIQCTQLFLRKKVIFYAFEHVKVTSGCVSVASLVVQKIIWTISIKIKAKRFKDTNLHVCHVALVA